MKTSAPFFALLAAALVAPAASAGAAEPAPGVTAFPNRPDPGLLPPQNLGRGARVSEVLLLLGEPDVRLAPRVWVYWDFQTNRADFNARGLDTLVVTFTDDRVDNLRVVRRQSVEAFLARGATAAAAAATAPPRVFAAK